MELIDILKAIDNEKAAALSLSKGGWEGWIQCELWSYLNLAKEPSESAEREVKYPNDNMYCDLVVGSNLWIEIKALGIFRGIDLTSFIDGIRKDLMKLREIPVETTGLMIVVIPKVIEKEILEEFQKLGWNGFKKLEGNFVNVLYID